MRFVVKTPNTLNFRIAFIGVLIASGCLLRVSAQTWYDQLMRQHTMNRFGFGLQAMEPTGFVIQMFKGAFCSGDDTYACFLTYELSAGFENVIAESKRSYRSGTWQKGGLQAGLNVLYPIYTFANRYLSAQVHVGAGLQGGTRKYTEENLDKTDNVMGGNLMMRFSYTGRSFEMSDGLWFLSYFADAKYYRQFGEDFYYFRPSLGVILRKVR